MIELRAERVLVDGTAEGEVIALDTPLSLWGGLDAATGRVVDPRHPQHGASLRGRVVVLPSGRGSSSASSVLLEAVRLGNAPCALLTREPDPILALGSLVAREIYQRWPPVLVLGSRAYRSLSTGCRAAVGRGGSLRVTPGPEGGG